MLSQKTNRRRQILELVTKEAQAAGKEIPAGLRGAELLLHPWCGSSYTSDAEDDDAGKRLPWVRRPQPWLTLQAKAIFWFLDQNDYKLPAKKSACQASTAHRVPSQLEKMKTSTLTAHAASVMHQIDPTGWSYNRAAVQEHMKLADRNWAPKAVTNASIVSTHRIINDRAVQCDRSGFSILTWSVVCNVLPVGCVLSSAEHARCLRTASLRRFDPSHAGRYAHCFFLLDRFRLHGRRHIRGVRNGIVTAVLLWRIVLHLGACVLPSLVFSSPTGEAQLDEAEVPDRRGSRHRRTISTPISTSFHLPSDAPPPPPCVSSCSHMSRRLPFSRLSSAQAAIPLPSQTSFLPPHQPLHLRPNLVPPRRRSSQPRMRSIGSLTTAHTASPQRVSIEERVRFEGKHESESS